MGQSNTMSRGRHGLDTSKYAIIYPRQSSDEQVKENIYSLERQMRLRELAVRDGFEDERILVVDDDLGMSGRRIEKRQGFTRALSLIEQRVVGAIYVEDLTRLSRDERTIDQMIIADACERSDALIYMGGSWYDMRDTGQRMSYKYQAVGLSEGWKAHLQKLHGAIREKARQGRVAGRVPRYGYRVNRDVPRRHPDRDKLIIHEPEAAIIRALVARLLEAGSIRELYRQVSPLYWPDGQVLTFRMLNQLLCEPVYRGHYHFGGETVEFAHEPIVPPDLAARVDELRAVNRTVKRKNPRDSGTLAGLLWCSTCARRFNTNGAIAGSEYRCLDRLEKDGHDAYHFGMSCRPVDALVLGELWRRLDGDLVAGIIASLATEQHAQVAAEDVGEAGRRELRKRIDGLTRSLSDPEIGDTARRVLLQQLEVNAAQLEAAENTRPIAPHVAADLAYFEDLRRDPTFIVGLQATWEDEPIMWRRTWVRRFIARIEVTQVIPGHARLVIQFRDGTHATIDHATRRAVSPAEMDAAREAWADPARPRRAWGEWLARQLTAAGFPRSSRGAIRTANLAGLTTSSPHNPVNVPDFNAWVTIARANGPG